MYEYESPNVPGKLSDTGRVLSFIVVLLRRSITGLSDRLPRPFRACEFYKYIHRIAGDRDNIYINTII